jgi:hypothetical protein
MLHRLHPTRRRTGAIAAVAIAALTAGGAYAASTTVSATSTDSVVTKTSNTNLSAKGGIWTPIIAVQLPAASSPTHYVLSAHGDLVNFGPSDYVRCQIAVNGAQAAAVATIVGDPSRAGGLGPAPFVSPYSLTGGADVPATGGTAVMECEHNRTNASTPYAELTSLWAHRTNSLLMATEP